MRLNRRQVLTGALLAAATSTGCLQGGAGAAGSDGDGNDGDETDDNDTDDDRNDGDDGNEPTTAVEEVPRVDEPPYGVEEQPNDPEAWNERYLCEGMPGESDLAFRSVPAPRPDLLLSTHDHGEGDAYAVRALTGAEEVREVFDGSDSDDGGGGPEDLIDRVDFDERVLLVVEDGYGSGSVAHHWKRVEGTDRGFRLHGCLLQPYERTADITSRHSVVSVERPDGFEFPRVSLTVDEERRVHFNATEGVVTVDPGG